MSVAGEPDLSQVKDWLGLDPADTADDVVLTESLNAALAQQALVVTYPVDAFEVASMTDDLREAVFLRTQRLAARRNSPEGVIGVSGAGGEFVGVRVPAYDGDVAALEAPWRVIAVS